MKKISIMLLALFAMTTSVSAAEIDVSQNNCIVTVNVDIERNEKDVAVLLRSEDAAGNIIYLDDSYTDADGKYFCEFDASSATGALTVTARVVGEGTVESSIIVRTQAVENEIIEAVSKENATKEEIKAVVEQYWSGLDMEDTLFNTLSDKDSVYEFLANDTQSKSIEDYDGFKNAFYSAVIIRKYAELADKNEICGYLKDEPYSEVLGEAYSLSYDLLNDTVKGKVTEGMSAGYTDSKKFYDDLEFSLLKNCIKYSSLWQELQPVLTNYAGKVGLTRSVTTQDCKTVIKQTYNTYSEILSALTKPVRRPSSSGGGSSSGAGVPVVVTPTNPPVKEVEEEKTGNATFTDMENHKWAEPYVQHVYELGIVSGYGDGSFKPAKNVTREEAVKMLVALIKKDDVKPLDELPFEDVPKDKWSYNYISSAYENKLVSGMSENYFGATLNVSRQEMAVMAWNVLKSMGIEDKNRLVFNDADEIAGWARDSVEILGGIDIIHGRTSSDGFHFDPKAPVTRAEAAVIISNMAKILP